MHVLLLQVLFLTCVVVTVDPETGGVVQRLMSRRDDLIQPGLSYINTSSINTVNTLSLTGLHNITHKHQIGCIINIENWSKWNLGNPVYYFKYGRFETSKLVVGYTFNFWLDTNGNSIALHSGPAEGTIRKKSMFTKTAVTYHILPSWGH